MRMPRIFAALLLAGGALCVDSCGDERAPDGSPSTPLEAPTGDNRPSWFNLKPMRYDTLPSGQAISLGHDVVHWPWPGDYWATFMGGIGNRWRDPKWNKRSEDGKTYKRYVYPIGSATDYAALDDAAIDKLSPAEKYDLWQNRTDLRSGRSATGMVRRNMLETAEYNKETYDEDIIPAWEGICNGWAVASSREPQPMNPVTVTNASGRKITFYPSDIKALMSQIYFDAQDEITVVRLGDRCDDEKLKRNKRGRIKKAECRDVNPMSLHLALTQIVGQNGRSFIYDRVATSEIWNQPVLGYSMRLGQPRPYDAKKDRDTYPYAARGTRYLVDVNAEIRYIEEEDPLDGKNGAITNDDIDDYIKTTRHQYTLELDQNQVVIGGEWGPESDVPDFLWYPVEDPSDNMLKKVDENYPLSYSLVKGLLSRSATTTAAARPDFRLSDRARTILVDRARAAQPDLLLVTDRARDVPLTSIGVEPAVRPNVRMHSDNNTRLRKMPAAFIGKSTLIQTRNRDFGSAAPSYVSFKTSRPATVFVLVDKRTERDDWLRERGFAPARGLTFVSSKRAASPLRVYARKFGKGERVSLPGQAIHGPVGRFRSNYSILVR